MMRAGKDYIAKGEPEYEEDGRSQHLRELLRTINGQSESAEPTAPEEVKDAVEEKPTKQTNQSKPILKLK